MTEFVGWRLCLIVFKTLSDRSRIRTHAHTRVPEFSTEEFLESGSLDLRPSCLVYVDTFFFDLWPFHWVIFSIQRFNLLNGLCHPYEKICVQTHEYFRVSHVSSGYLFLCSFKQLGYQPQTTLRLFGFLLLYTVILNWCSSMTKFVGWRLCLIVFKTLSDRSRIRTHAHTRVPEFSTEEFLESGSLDLPPSCLVYVDTFFFFRFVAFPLGNFFNSEM